MRAFVIGNGPSLKETNLDLLIGERTYAVNAIWKLFGETKWRPTDWVHGERRMDGDEITESLRKMSKTDSRLWVHTGMFQRAGRRDISFGRPVIPYVWCDRLTREKWHLDSGDYICKYGTSVNVAVQLAVLNGASEIYLLGCDLGDSHFYNEKFGDSDLAYDAHKIASECCPVPIYNATVGGKLDIFPRISLEEVINGKAKEVHGSGTLRESPYKWPESRK